MGAEGGGARWQIPVPGRFILEWTPLRIWGPGREGLCMDSHQQASSLSAITPELSLDLNKPGQPVWFSWHRHLLPQLSDLT